MKRCSHCRTLKAPNEYHRNASAHDGLQSKCKPCNNTVARAAYERRKTDGRPYWKTTPVDPEKLRARRMVKDHVRRGTLAKPQHCQACGALAGELDGHHDDYSKPLNVVWLCKLCHHRLHAQEAVA